MTEDPITAVLQQLADHHDQLTQLTEVITGIGDTLREHQAALEKLTETPPADPDGYHEAAAAAARIAAALTGPDHEPVPCHNDLLPANFLYDGDRIRIVDWEYAGMGDRFFDLGNLAVNNAFGPDDEERLIAGYFGEPGQRRLAALRLMRVMSDFREAMWGAVQDVVSELDFDYAAYRDEHFERLLAAIRVPEFERSLADATAP